MNLDVLNEIRMEQMFCDAVLKAEETMFPVHKVIMCGCSPYFQSIFLRWLSPDQVFDIPSVSAAILEIIIKFAYTASVAVTENNVQELVLASDMLNVTGVLEVCSRFMGERLCTQNCVGIWRFTNVCHMPELYYRSFHYIMENFERVFEMVEFFELSVHQLKEIISRDELNVSSETVVFDAIVRWVQYMRDKRERHMAELLSEVRLALTSDEYIGGQVSVNNLVRHNPDCQVIVEDAIQMIWHRTSHRPSRPGRRNTLARPRLPHSLLLVTGGWSEENPVCNMEVYDPTIDLWIMLREGMEYPRAYHACVVLDHHVYVLGGLDSEDYFNSMVRLDLSTKKWDEVSPMHHRRCYVSATTMNGYIYAMGGYDGHERLNSAECYCPETNQWNLIAPMNLKRSDASSTSLNNRVYICGGFSGSIFLPTAECYNPIADQWTVTRPMNTSRGGLKAAAYNNQIYVVGGCDGFSHLSTVEVYSPPTDSWTVVSPMNYRRSHFSLSVVGDLIYVVGGQTGFSSTRESEMYRPRTDQWSVIRDSGLCRLGAAACTISGLPNISDFTLSRDSLLFLQMDEESVSQS